MFFRRNENETLAEIKADTRRIQKEFDIVAGLMGITMLAGAVGMGVGTTNIILNADVYKHAELEQSDILRDKLVGHEAQILAAKDRIKFKASQAGCEITDTNDGSVYKVGKTREELELVSGKGELLNQGNNMSATRWTYTTGTHKIKHHRNTCSIIFKDIACVVKSSSSETGVCAPVTTLSAQVQARMAEGKRFETSAFYKISRMDLGPNQASF